MLTNLIASQVYESPCNQQTATGNNSDNHQDQRRQGQRLIGGIRDSIALHGKPRLVRGEGEWFAPDRSRRHSRKHVLRPGRRLAKVVKRARDRLAGGVDEPEEGARLFGELDDWKVRAAPILWVG